MVAHRHNKTPARPAGHIDEDVCTDILHGLLSRDEVEPILDHIGACDACERLFRGRVADLERLRSRTAAVGRAAPAASGVARLPARVRPWLGAFSPRLATASLSVAAAIVVLLVVVVTRGPSPDRALPVYRIPDRSGLVELRSSGGEVDRDLQAGIQVYEAGDFARAAELLARAQLDTPYDKLRNVYLSSALTLLERHDEALTLLDSMEALELPQPWRDESEWIRCIALFGVGRDAEAITLLDRLASTGGAIGLEARRWRERVR